MTIVFVPDIPEFMPLIEGAVSFGKYTVREPKNGYWRIESSGQIIFTRKELGLGPALWNSALTGGYCGRILEYDRDSIRIESED